MIIEEKKDNISPEWKKNHFIVKIFQLMLRDSFCLTENKFFMNI